MDKEEFYELVTKELCGTAEQHELEELWSMVARYGWQEEYQRIKANWDQQLTEVGATPYNISRVRQRIIDGVRQVEPDFHMDSPHTVERSRPSRSIWLQVAAVITLLIASAVFVYQYTSQPEVEQVAAVRWIEKETRAGQNTTITFQDGSTITLNGNSSIRFPESFDEASREVHFSGEGYFDIETDPSRPFIVHMNEYSVKVLGTIFNINNSDPDQWSVSLVEGRVVVGEESAEDKVVLKPGEQAAFDTPNHRVIIEPFDIAQVTGWKDKTFIFKSEALESVLRKLERRYGVSFEYTKDQVEHCEVTASFKNETVWTILEAIRFSTGLEYEVKDKNRVMLKGKGCKNRD